MLHSVDMSLDLSRPDAAYTECTYVLTLEGQPARYCRGKGCQETDIKPHQSRNKGEICPCPGHDRKQFGSGSNVLRHFLCFFVYRQVQMYTYTREDSLRKSKINVTFVGQVSLIEAGSRFHKRLYMWRFDITWHKEMTTELSVFGVYNTNRSSGHPLQ